MRCADLRVLFVAPAGPRRGFGHLVRCRSLARALGVRPLVALRGGRSAVEAALALGCDVIAGETPRLIGRLHPDVLVVDDPIARPAAAWIAAGRRAGVLVVSVHDLGIGCLDADVVVDGSVTRNARGARGRTLAGTRYAVIDPGLRRVRRRMRAEGPRVLVSLGGGPRARRAEAIARAIADAHPAARLRVVGGLVPARGTRRHERIEWIAAPRGLAGELARADVAIVGGGVSLYESCALGVPAVAIPVVRAQVPTVSGFRVRGAALGIGLVDAGSAEVAAHAGRLIGDRALRDRVARAARALVDGRGASRVAAVIRTVARQRLGARPADGGAGVAKARTTRGMGHPAACAA